MASHWSLAGSKLKTIKVRGFPIAYEDTGEGKALVFVHGACENSLFWNHQKILSDRFRIVALDLPGHGESEPSIDAQQISIALLRYCF